MANERVMPKEDIEDITRALTATSPSMKITKNAKGDRVASGAGASSPMAVKSYAGKRLRHNKVLFVPKVGAEIIGEKGDLFDDIPLDKKRKVVWMDNDFET